MTNIGEVIGWKFNHQAGMETRDGVITAFPGGIPSQADQDTWRAEYEAYLPTKAWGEQMTQSDSTLIPRWLEDHIKDDHGGLTDNPQLQAKYDAKVLLRSQRP